MSKDRDLFGPIKKQNMSLISNRLESLRVLLLEIDINSLKFALFSSVFPNLEQIYLDGSRIVCYCKKKKITGFSGYLPNHLMASQLNHCFADLNRYKIVPKYGINSQVTPVPERDCHRCMFTLIKSLNTFERLPKIRYISE